MTNQFVQRVDEKKSRQLRMEGLKERNTNITRSNTRRIDKEKSKPISFHPPGRRGSFDATKAVQEKVEKTTKQATLDDEEMLFLARRCLAEELKSRSTAPAALLDLPPPAAPSVTHVTFQAAVPVPIAPAPAAPLAAPAPAAPAVVVRPLPAAAAPVVAVRPAPVAALGRNKMFQLHRLGVGLIVLKFGWIWVSCGGLIMADSVFCTSDVCMLVLRRMRQHAWQVGARLHTATRESVKLFTEDTD